MLGEKLGVGHAWRERKGHSETGAAVKDRDEGGVDLGGSRGGIGPGYILEGKQMESAHSLNERAYKRETMMVAPKFSI